MFKSCLKNASLIQYRNLIQQRFVPPNLYILFKILIQISLALFDFFSKRLLHKTYYDVLKLKPNCSEKEIRDAFIKLSKEVSCRYLMHLVCAKVATN